MALEPGFAGVWKYLSPMQTTAARQPHPAVIPLVHLNLSRRDAWASGAEIRALAVWPPPISPQTGRSAF